MDDAEPPEFDPAGKRTCAAGTLLATWLLAAAVGCSEAPSRPPDLPDAPAPRAGEIVVRLAFPTSADLDLYVTGPDLESVYFANTPSKLGGELEQDLRCDAPPGPRVEIVRFRNAPRGRYRVGVDYPEHCELPARAAPYLLEVRAAGLDERLSGRSEPGEFEPVVLEFDYPNRRP